MRRILSVVLLAGILGGALACTKEEPRPLRVGTDRVTVSNLTDTAWRDVEVRVLRTSTRTGRLGVSISLALGRLPRSR